MAFSQIEVFCLGTPPVLALQGDIFTSAIGITVAKLQVSATIKFNYGTPKFT